MTTRSTPTPAARYAASSAGTSFDDSESALCRFALRSADARDPQRDTGRGFWLFYALITLAVVIVVGLLLIEVGAYGGWR